MVTSQEIESVKLKLERMDNAEIAQVIQYANMISTNRQIQRKKELWGNVVAAIQKYYNEFQEEIEIHGIDHDGWLCADNLYLDKPGVFNMCE